ncbi:WD40 repeat protein [Mucilaginibacter gracilis]|uniref:WD40 repeat protein n=1 Tax=Mucilaginibacter gracilis TaxID=423350 RepID=A0A495J0S3_9SPHI|nr:OmpA family protein [Mucilaginibacter gracilis]RKR82312.1 WD40 repeat protein [Mucilaginibacter gracilis]
MKKIFTIVVLIALIMLVKEGRAQAILKEADEQYNLFNYKKAAELYSQAYWQKETLYTAERLATCYRLMHDYKNTESWYVTAMGFPGSKSANILYYAEALKNNSKYSEAKEQFESYAALDKEVTRFQLSIWLSSCDSSMRWMRHPTAIVLKNERALNSPQSDWGAVKYQNSVVFTSDRFNKKAEKAAMDDKPFLKIDGDKLPDRKIYGWTGNDYLRLYQSPVGGSGGDSLKLFSIAAPTDYHVGAAAFSKDGNEIYFTLTRAPQKSEGPKSVIKTINLEIYWAKKNPATGGWQKPVPFKYNNVDKYSVGDPFVSPDGKTLYFVSDMPGGKGGTDIYYCQRDEQGDWGTPVNLRDLNTAGNERTPIVDEGNNHIYFSSDGGVGMGGLDIYKAERNGLTFGRILNLAYPINSPQDDFAFTLTGGGSGYFSSNRLGGLGSDDIYSFSDKQFVNYRLEGITYDKITRLPLVNSIVTLTKTGGTELKVQTDSLGMFQFNLEEESDYTLMAEKTNFRSDNQAISTVGLTTSQTIKKNLYLEKTTLNKAIRIENIYYDFNKSNIRRDAAIELNKLIKILNENPTIWIVLGSHTDSRGNDAYNLALSQRRANAAVKYIIEKGGIDKNRISARGYGETRLLNRCANGVKCSEAEHQLNRRTEFTIVKQ